MTTTEQNAQTPSLSFKERESMVGLGCNTIYLAMPKKITELNERGREREKVRVRVFGVKGCMWSGSLSVLTVQKVSLHFSFEG